MAHKHVYEGTLDEIVARYGQQLAGMHLKVIVDEEDEQEMPAPRPNEKARAALAEIARRQAGRPHTDGSDTLRLIREARSGAMYGYDPAE